MLVCIFSSQISIRKCRRGELCTKSSCMIGQQQNRVNYFMKYLKLEICYTKFICMKLSVDGRIIKMLSYPLLTLSDEIALRVSYIFCYFFLIHTSINFSFFRVLRFLRMLHIGSKTFFLIISYNCLQLQQISYPSTPERTTVIIIAWRQKYMCEKWHYFLGQTTNKSISAIIYQYVRRVAVF